MSALTLPLIAVLLIVAIGTISNAQCPVTTITLAQYTSIQIGWTIAQVTTAVGNAGTPTSESATIITISYQGATPGGAASILFMNGVVYTKSQYGLC
jgi:hypothetical protein